MTRQAHGHTMLPERGQCIWNSEDGMKHIFLVLMSLSLFQGWPDRLHCYLLSSFLPFSPPSSSGSSLLLQVCSPMSSQVRGTHLSSCIKPAESLMLVLLHTILCSHGYETPWTTRSSATLLVPQHSLQESLRENILCCSGIISWKSTFYLWEIV